VREEDNGEGDGDATQPRLWGKKVKTRSINDEREE